MLRHAALISALVLVGCADTGDEGMIVLNNTAVSGSCDLTGDPSQPFVSHGEIYALSNKGYTLTPLIQSRVTSGDQTGGTAPDPIQKTIFLRSADISLSLEAVSIETGGAFTDTQPKVNVGQFQVLFSGSLPPSGSVNVGFEVITPSILRDIVTRSGANLTTSNLRAEVLATVTINGTLNGDNISALPFNYPISVCNDCVVIEHGTCPITDVTTIQQGNACNLYQDGQVDCCRDSTGKLICPGSLGTP